MSLLSIVTIDDEAYVHEGLDSLMEWDRIGYAHVGSALNGEDGLSLVANLRPDVILTDIRMPAMSGLELIARVREMPNYHPAFVVISGYDEFEYARTALRHQVDDYLLKPIDEQQLEEQLVRIGSRLRAQMVAAGAVHPAIDGTGGRESVSVLNTAIRRLLSGERAEEIVQLAERRLDPAHGEQLLVAVLVPVDTELTALRQPLSATEVRYALASTKARASLDWVVSEPYGGVATLLQTRDVGDQLDLWVQGLYHAIASSVSRPLLLAVSAPCATVAELLIAREELQRFFTTRHLVDRTGYVIAGASSASMTGSSAGGSGHAPAPDLERVIESVEEIDAGSAAASLRDVFERLASRGASSDALRDYVNGIRAQGDRLVLELGGNPSDTPLHEELQYLARNAEFIPMTVLLDSSVRFVGALAERVAELRRTQRHTAVALMKRRADRRFAEDISIAGFADEYEMNAVYLGQLFRKSVGVGFKDYLRARRIREACRLLRDTDMLVPEIAQTVGYRDVDYFTDQFKREMELTPNAYRIQRSRSS